MPENEALREAREAVDGLAERAFALARRLDDITGYLDWGQVMAAAGRAQEAVEGFADRSDPESVRRLVATGRIDSNAARLRLRGEATDA